MANKDNNNHRDGHNGTKVPYGGLTQDEVEYIIERAAKRASELACEPAAHQAIAIIQQEVGRNTIRAAYWAFCAIVLGLLGWLGAKGLIR